MSATPNLEIVREPPEEAEPAQVRPELGDLALLAALFAVNLVPIAGELARLGRWSPGIVGFATGAALLSGRELWSELRARAPRASGLTRARPR